MHEKHPDIPLELTRLLGAEGLIDEPLSVQPLSGDGSDRRFFRISGAHQPLLAALPCVADTDACLAEARSAIHIGNHLRRQNIPVPEIIAADTATGIIIFEDLGDILLADAGHELAANNPGALEGVYLHIIELLFEMQTAGRHGFDVNWCWDTPLYDRQLMLERESGYFIRAFCQQRLGMLATPPGLDSEFRLLADRAASQPATFFLHRDFQSRNIMLHKGEIRFIDFQGGRLGPLGYDIASLLIDPYAALTEIQKSALLEKYVSLIEAHGINSETFMAGYYCLALQRNLQILGAFSFLSGSKEKTFFAQFIMPAALSLQQLLAKAEGEDYPCLRSLIDRCIDRLEQAQPAWPARPHKSLSSPGPSMTDPEHSQSRSSIVALIGRPNVGKSTLFNRLCKTRKAIVDPTPGVTRDRHYEKVVWNERRFILIDTGGLDVDKEDVMVDRIREQTMQAIDEADIILFILDARGGVTPADHEVADLLRRTDKPTFHVVNKIDSPELENTLLASFYELGISTLWPIAAEHGYGVGDLLDALVESMPTEEEDQALPEDVIRLAFFGRPNVGKSSIINRILGEERMVVSEIAGTTRDSVDTILTKGKRNYLLIDTAGIRRKGKVREKLEKFSVMRALGALDRCDIALLLVDSGEGITEQDTKVIGYIVDEGRACIILLNKWDLIKGDKKREKHLLTEVEMATRFVSYAPVMKVSALTGEGTSKIFSTIGAVYKQFNSTFTTGRLNRMLQETTESHPPSMYQGRRIKFYYTTQITSRPPTFALVTNFPKNIHFSYHRYLTNTFRKELGLDKIPLRVLFRERKGRKEKIGGRKIKSR